MKGNSDQLFRTLRAHRLPGDQLNLIQRSPELQLLILSKRDIIYFL